MKIIKQYPIAIKSFKAIILFLFLLIIPVFSFAQNQKINLSNQTMPISAIFAEIEKQTDFSFAFNREIINVDKTITIPEREQSLTELLAVTLANTNVEYKINKNQILIVPAKEQVARIIKGLVLDNMNEPIIGVNVVEKGTTNGVMTDMDGQFSLTVQRGAVLLFSYIGYKNAEYTIGEEKQITILLEEDIKALNEVVVIGYGTQSKREISGSITQISENSFNKGLSRDASDLLQGKVAGLTITPGSGDVTRNSTIRLRGTTTLQNDLGPLIVVDDVPGGDLSTIAPQDIESISVLKDASSAAIYGSRAAGGVILVTTKRGSGSNPQLSYDGYLSIDQLSNKPDLLNADEWRSYAKSVGQDYSMFDQYGADTDWFDEITRTGISQNHSLSMSGGGSKNNYRASFTYLDREGIMRDNSLERYNFRFQFQQRAINDRLRVGLTGSATITDKQMPYSQNAILAYNMLPVYPVYNADGSYFTKVNAEYDQGNPVQNQDLNSKKSNDIYFYGVGDIQFKITDGLYIKSNLYKSRFSTEFTQYNDSRTSIGLSENGFAQKQSQVSNRNLMEWTLNYDKSFGKEDKHKINSLLGYSWEENTYSYFKSQNRDFLTNILGSNNLQSGMKLQQGDVESGKNSYKLISMFARMQYSYNERYMITATLRRDGSSKFGENHKWGLFPSTSVAWGISEEEFMKDVSWLDNLKLRVGYGVTGNQDGLQPYKSLSLYGTAGRYYDNGNWRTAYKISQNDNPDLKWESTAMLNLGLDFSLWNNRLSGTIEWYDKNTSDMLYTYKVPTPPYVYEKMQANVGNMSNRGVEMQITAGIIQKQDFNWTLSVNLSHNKNEVTKLSNDLFSTSRIYTGDPWIRGAGGTSHIVEEGRPIGQFFMLECLGIKDGKYVINDINKDGKITNDDRTYVGDAQPDLTFGIDNSFVWKNWDLGFFLRGTLGNKVLNNPRAAYGNNTYLIGANAMDDELMHTMKESSYINSYYIEDGSFIRLDNLSLGYTFNTHKISWLNKARIYLAAQNLFVITKYKGLDPEVELFTGKASDQDAGLSPGIEPRDYYPKSRTFTFGLSLIF